MATVMLEVPRLKRSLPEEMEFRDVGCDLYPSCLSCPLPRCRYDEPGGAPAMLRVGRDAAIRRLRGEGRTVDEIAGELNCSRRTVFRVLREVR